MKQLEAVGKSLGIFVTLVEVRQVGPVGWNYKTRSLTAAGHLLPLLLLSPAERFPHRNHPRLHNVTSDLIFSGAV